jgi:hypothetical protein
MDVVRRTSILTFAITFAFTALAVAGQGSSVIGTDLSSSEMEQFLRTAKISDVRDAGAGVTGSQRAWLSDGRIRHEAHIQAVDIAKAVFNAGAATELNFRDTYRYNIAGYRLARLLEINTVPMSVERNVNGKTAAVTWWVDDVKMNEGDRTKMKTMGPNPLRTSNQIQLMHIWDELIQNRDRNQGNILWTSDYTMWLIDHTRAFRSGTSLLKPDRLHRIDRALYDRMKQLTAQAVTQAMKDSLTRREIESMLKRRDAIVKLFDRRVAERGEAAVFFTLSPPAAR